MNAHHPEGLPLICTPDSMLCLGSHSGTRVRMHTRTHAQRGRPEAHDPKHGLTCIVTDIDTCSPTHPETHMLMLQSHVHVLTHTYPDTHTRSHISHMYFHHPMSPKTHIHTTHAATHTHVHRHTNPAHTFTHICMHTDAQIFRHSHKNSHTVACIAAHPNGHRHTPRGVQSHEHSCTHADVHSHTATSLWAPRRWLSTHPGRRPHHWGAVNTFL